MGKIIEQRFCSRRDCYGLVTLRERSDLEKRFFGEVQELSCFRCLKVCSRKEYAELEVFEPGLTKKILEQMPKLDRKSRIMLACKATNKKQAKMFLDAYAALRRREDGETKEESRKNALFMVQMVAMDTDPEMSRRVRKLYFE